MTGQFALICECGCGEPVRIGKHGPNRFATGHGGTRKKRLEDHLVAGTPDECWLWTGRVNNEGYGMLGAQGLAHRHAYERAHGLVPDGLNVLHRCDTPRCCNPDHLFVGTQLDNVADAIRKGRFRPRGKEQPPRPEYRRAA